MNGAVVPQPMDCERVIELAWDWLDDELDPVRWVSIEAHLAVCTGCSDHVAFARNFIDHVHAAPLSAADVGTLRERVARALRKDG